MEAICKLSRTLSAQFALTHPIVDDMGKGKVFGENGIIFVYLHGTVAFQIPNDELSRRLSLAMAITERRGYLLTWFFAAPHDSELIGLTNERAIFDTAAIRQRGQRRPAGGSGKSRFCERLRELQCDRDFADCGSGERSSAASTAAASDSASCQFRHPSSSDCTTPASGDQKQSSDSSGERSSLAAAAGRERCRPSKAKASHQAEINPRFTTETRGTRANQAFLELSIRRRPSGRRGICCFPAPQKSRSLDLRS